jgi:hypothetical protein
VEWPPRLEVRISVASDVALMWPEVGATIHGAIEIMVPSIVIDL